MAPIDPVTGYSPDAGRRARPRAVLLLALLAATSLSGCTTFWTGEQSGPAPAYHLTDIDGTIHNGTTHAGQWVLLDFMGTWCDICERSRPRLAALQADYPDLVILSVSATDTAGQLGDYRHRVHNPWPMAVDDDGVTRRYTDGGGASRPMYPSYALIDPAGDWVFWTRGETFPAVIATHLGAPTDTDVPWATTLVAAGLGIAAWTNPFAAAGSLGTRDAATRRRQTLAAAAAVAMLTFVAVFGARPLAGRLYVPLLIATVAVPGMLWWWRHRGTDGIQGRRKEHGPWRRDAGHVANTLFVGAPLLLPVLASALLQTATVGIAAPIVAFGAGLVMASAVGWHNVPRRRALTLGAAGLVVGAAWGVAHMLIPTFLAG